jgi:signal transduction histidine kinase
MNRDHALELHDSAVKSLIDVKMRIDLVRRQVEANRPIDMELGHISQIFAQTQAQIASKTLL